LEFLHTQLKLGSVGFTKQALIIGNHRVEHQLFLSKEFFFLICTIVLQNIGCWGSTTRAKQARAMDSGIGTGKKRIKQEKENAKGRQTNNTPIAALP
jgi:hypothetical protein